MHTALHVLAQLIALATVGQFVAAMILHYRAGPQRVVDAVVLAGALASLATHGWLCVFPNAMPTTVEVAIAIVLLAVVNRMFWLAVSPDQSVTQVALPSAGVFQAVATIRPLGFLAHPFYRAYMLGFCAFSLLGWHSIQCITAVVMAFTFDGVARAQARLWPGAQQLGNEYRADLLRAWGMLPTPRWSAALRARLLGSRGVSDSARVHRASLQDGRGNPW
jgi:hypothetical protein